jgi:hypothetical protein
MAIVDTLLKTAFEDTQLLLKNNSLGNQFSIPRDVDFTLVAPDEAKATTVCQFINDNQYGVARVENTAGQIRIVVAIHMPIEQHILCSVSGLMASIAEIFGLQYSGWGSVVAKPSNQSLEPTAGRRDDHI